MNAEALSPTILLPAFVAGLLVLATHIPLGREVLERGIVFIDLAIAQFAGVGILVAHRFGLAEHGWQMQGAAFGAAVAGAAVLRWRERRNVAQQEAFIGCSFVLASSVAVLLMAKDVRGGEHLQHILVGQILWTTWWDLLPLAMVAAFVLGVLFALRGRRSVGAFYLPFAVAVTASVQIVGVYLVFASLIVPALCAGERRSLAFAVGVGGYALGLVASACFDVPSGAAIVLALALTGMLASRTKNSPRPV